MGQKGGSRVYGTNCQWSLNSGLWEQKATVTRRSPLLPVFTIVASLSSLPVHLVTDTTNSLVRANYEKSPGQRAHPYGSRSCCPDEEREGWRWVIHST